MRQVVYSPRARDQHTEPYLWIAEQAGFPDLAVNYVTAIFDYCEELADFPFIGVSHELQALSLIHISEPTRPY